MNKSEELGEVHAEQYAKRCKRIYKEAFIHGYKQGLRAGLSYRLKKQPVGELGE